MESNANIITPKQLTDEYIGYVLADERLDADRSQRKLAWETMSAGPCTWNGGPTPFSYIPRIYNNATRQKLISVAENTHKLLEKAILRYRNNADFREQFTLDKRVERLVMLPTIPAECPLPYARVDFALNEESGQLQAIEFNTEASSGMLKHRESLRAIADTAPFKQFCCRHKTFDDCKLFYDGWADCFEKLAGIKPGKNIAIVALFESEQPDLGELESYKTLFESRGYNCSVFDARQLNYRDGALVGCRALSGTNNMKIDAVWRFAIVVDLLKYWDEVQGFIAGVESGAATMIGGFQTQIAHDKQLFNVLQLEAAKCAKLPLDERWLTSDEIEFIQNYIPPTVFLNETNAVVALANKDHYVIKPTDWYSSLDVVVGSDVDSAKWRDALKNALLSPGHGGPRFLLQEACELFETDAIGLYGNEEDFLAKPQPMKNVLGLYLHAGKFAGVYMRQGPDADISPKRQGLVAPVIFVEE